MNKVPFSEDELKIVGQYVAPTESWFAPPKIYNTPITAEQNLRAALKGEDYLWMPTLTDICNVQSRINPDHIARAEVQDLGPKQALEEKGGPDLFGVEWVFVPTVGGSMEKPGNPHLLNDANEWKEKIVWPDIDSFDWEGMAKLNAPFRDQPRVIGCTFQNGMFERLISFMGFEGASMALIDEDQQDAVKELFDKLADMYIHFISKYREAIGVREVYFHDDWGSQRAPFFSVDTCIEMIVPAIRKIADWCHERDMIFQLHSCGKNELLVPAMIEAHVDIWWGQTMNDKAMLYEKYGDKIMLGIDVPPLPMDADHDTIVKTAKEFVAKYTKYPAMAAAFMTPPGMMEEIYKQSRIALCGIA